MGAAESAWQESEAEASAVRARLVETEAALRRADGRKSIEEASEALRRCVEAGFMDADEARAKWLARLRLEAP